MEENIIISNLNDFIYCPRSIYFHNLYASYDEHMYQGSNQIRGNQAHKKIDTNKYSTSKTILEGINIYSEELGVIGKIDLFDITKGILTERKNKIKKLYDGYYLQIHAQFFCLKEMGYNVKQIRFYSKSDNKIYDIKLPGINEKNKIKEVIIKMKTFSLEDDFTQNFEKCRKCIYRELCDYYTDDE